MVTARRAPSASSAPSAAPRRAAAAPATSSGYHGAEGRRKMQEEEERSLARKEASAMNASMPFRFFCLVGETREVVVIDEEPSFFRYEHNLKDSRSGKWTVFTACVNESANCPVCKVAERPSYFAMYLTVIDLKPYDSEKHGTIPWSKKLMVVKSAQQKKITRLWERHKTLRGMILSMTRDGEKDASIGNDIEFVEFMDEDELADYETTYEYEKDGKKMTKDIIAHEVFDYDALFPMPTEQSLRAIVGGRPEAGSREEGDRTTGRSRGDDWDEPAAARTRPARGSAIPRGAAEEPIGDEVDDAPPRRAATRTAAPPARAAAPARAAPARRAAPAAHDDEAEEAEEGPADPPQRTVRRAAPPAAAAPAPARRQLRTAPAENAEDEHVDELPPATSLAERRRSLRR